MVKEAGAIYWIEAALLLLDENVACLPACLPTCLPVVVERAEVDFSYVHTWKYDTLLLYVFLAQKFVL